MAMRDPNEWAESLPYAMVMYDETEPDRDYLAIVIREAQEDGAREWRERAEVAECERDPKVQKWLDRCCALEAQVAALTERAEKAEAERDTLLRKEAEWQRVYGAAVKGEP